VHDPKSIGATSVKANIKLRFTNRAGTQMVVVRSMELTQKKTNMTFKALDGILRTTDANTGERLSLSHKCSELDRQIPMLLGVSKPILEHVVFCHQEDSSWPLMEGAVLKKRFDDIFDSTRYAKALKAIQETKKEYSGIVKDLKGELNGLASHKHAAKGFRQELSKHSEQLEELEEDLEACRKEIKQVEEEIKRNELIAEQVEELRCDLEDKRSELEKQISVEQTQKSMLQEDMTRKHSTRELKEILRDFDNQVGKQLERKRDLEREAQSLQKAMEAIQQEDKSLRQRIGKLDAEKVAHDKMLQKRLTKMDEMAAEYTIELPVTQTQNASFVSTQGSVAETVGDSTVTGGTQDSVVSVTAEDMHLFLKAVSDKQAELKQTLHNHTEGSQKDGDKIQDELNEMTAQYKAIEHGMLLCHLSIVRSGIGSRSIFVAVYRVEKVGEGAK
jgi:DNA repair protein RAD50